MGDTVELERRARCARCRPTTTIAAARSAARGPTRSATSSRGRRASTSPATPTSSTRWRDLPGDAPLDVALLPVWGWGPSLGAGHMDPARAAAEAAALLRPRLAIPIHWGTLYPVALHRVRPIPLTDPPHLFARFAASLAPDVDVRIVRARRGADARRAGPLVEE